MRDNSRLNRHRPESAPEDAVTAHYQHGTFLIEEGSFGFLASYDRELPSEYRKVSPAATLNGAIHACRERIQRHIALQKHIIELSHQAIAELEAELTVNPELS